MLDNTITLAVDVANDSNLVNQAFERYDEYQNRSVYIGPNHSVASPNTCSFYRTQPKAAGNFKGMAKTAFKFSENLALTGIDGADITAPAIVEVSFAFPVGTTVAKQLELRQRAIALLDMDAVMVDLNSLLMI